MVSGTVKDQITLYDVSITDEDVIEAAKAAGIHDAIMELDNGYDSIHDVIKEFDKKKKKKC